MTDYIVNGSDLTSIADKIRAKGQTSASIVFPGGFADAIDDLPDAPVLEPLTVTDNGDYTPGAGVDGFSRVLVNVQGGGGGASAGAVNFRDYDGTIVQSYSAADFAALTAMPANPSHTGLTAQGWNWTLAKAQAYVAKYGMLDIGQMYITDDGKTRVYIHLEQGRTSPMLGVCPDGTVDVDWGDGTEHDTLTGTSTTTLQWTPTHNYAAPGNYVIQLTVTGSMGFYGNSSSNQYSGLLRYASDADNRNRVYQNAIQRIEIGRGVTSIGTYAFGYCSGLSSISIPDGVPSIGEYAFNNCNSLSSISIPDGVTSIGNYAFSYCYGLSSISIPDGVTSIGSNAFQGCYNLASISIPDSVPSIGNYVFYGCYSLSSISIPDGVTSIGNYAFSYCYGLSSISIPDGVTSIGSNAFSYCRSLVSISIPDSVTSIGSSAFSGCYGISEYHFARTTPPTLSRANAFTGISADCIMYVPVGSLEAYKAASNWSNYASYMREESPAVNVFGVHWPYSTSSSTALTRLTPASDPNGYVTTSVDTEPVPAVGDGAGSSPFDAFAPWKDMEEYNVIDGALSYKKGEAGFSRTDYDTVVKLPDAYTKIVDTGTDMYFYVADGPVEGFALHPGSGSYVGRYHTGTGYVSKSGLPAEVNMTRATARTNSHAKGADWWQWGIASWQLIQMLYLVEFADFNSQAKIGTGIAYRGGVEQNSGATDSMVYHTGRAAGTDGQTAVQYRGVENLWGNYYAWLDGVNFNNHAAYVCIDPASYADDTETGYTATGLTLPSSNSYIKNMAVSSAQPWLMLPKTNGGSQTTYVSDYVYSTTGWDVALVAGNFSTAYRGYFGLFFLSAYYTSSLTSANLGSRLLFIP